MNDNTKHIHYNEAKKLVKGMGWCWDGYKAFFTEVGHDNYKANWLWHLKFETESKRALRESNRRGIKIV